MPKFIPNRPVSTRSPRVEVAPGLKPGRYRFRLVVSNAAGVVSQPSDWLVTIAKPTWPNPASAQPTSAANADDRGGASAGPRLPVLNRLAGLLCRLGDRLPF